MFLWLCPVLVCIRCSQQLCPCGFARYFPATDTLTRPMPLSSKVISSSVFAALCAHTAQVQGTAVLYSSTICLAMDSSLHSCHLAAWHSPAQLTAHPRTACSAHSLAALYCSFRAYPDCTTLALLTTMLVAQHCTSQLPALLLMAPCHHSLFTADMWAMFDSLILYSFECICVNSLLLKATSIMDMNTPQSIV